MGCAAQLGGDTPPRLQERGRPGLKPLPPDPDAGLIPVAWPAIHV